MMKFQFSILTQNRLKIDSISIMGKDREDAERKLRQMYRYCEVISCDVKSGATKTAPKVQAEEKAVVARTEDKTSMEDILTLLSS